MRWARLSTPRRGEEIVKAGAMLGDAVAKIQASSIKKVEVIERVNDPVILNTIQEDGCAELRGRAAEDLRPAASGQPAAF